ncbi:MAG: addiction module protein [Planctomycetota bacterium]|jgi:putative addiction module component (TIGR02574 family)
MDLYTESIRSLPLGDRLKLIQTIWDDIVSSDEQIPVPNSAIQEAKRRRDEMLVDPAIGMTHGEVWEKIKDARR